MSPWGRRSASASSPAGGLWSLWRSILVAAALLGALLAAASIGLFVTSQRLRSAQHRQTVSLDTAQNDAAVLLGDYLDQETGLRGYLIGGHALFLQPYRQADTAIPATERALSTEVVGNAAETRRLGVVEKAYRAWSDQYASPTVAAVDAGHLRQAQTVGRTILGKTLFDKLRTQLALLRGALHDEQRSNEAAIVHLQDRLEALLIGALAVLAVTMAGAVAGSLVKVIRPLDALTVAGRRVADGDLHAPVPVRGPAELRSLARDVASMRYRLLEEINQGRLAGEALHHDSPTVSALSGALMPRLDRHPDIASVARLDPAEGVLAGDWYDLIRVGPKLAVVIGDVSGHGPSAAVLALGLRSVVNTVLERGGAPGEALAAAAAHIAHDVPEHFATIFVAVLDPAAGELAYANAGHPAAILHVAGHPATWEELAPTGPLISPIVALWSWSTRMQRFAPGDGILAYTDGVIEGRNALNEQYGVERLKVDLDAAPLLADEVVELIADNVNAFVGGSQSDDRTLVYCQRLVRTPTPARPV